MQRLPQNQSAYCPKCELHTSQGRGAERGTRYCGSCGETFTLTESRAAEADSVHPAPTTPPCKHCGGPCVLSVTQVATTSVTPEPICTCFAPPTEQHATYCPREGMDYDAPATTPPSARAAAEDIAKKYAHHYWDYNKMVANCEAIILSHCGDSAAAMKDELADTSLLPKRKVRDA